MASALLIGLGFDELSMSAASLAQVKRTLGEFSLPECRELATKAIQSTSGHEVIQVMADAMMIRGLSLLVPPGLRE